MDNTRGETPVFVKVDEYKELLDVIGLVKTKIKESREIMGRINQLKNEEDSELELWKNEIEEVERKVDFIDKSLFEPGF